MDSNPTADAICWLIGAPDDVSPPQQSETERECLVHQQQGLLASVLHGGGIDQGEQAQGSGPSKHWGTKIPPGERLSAMISELERAAHPRDEEESSYISVIQDFTKGLGATPGADMGEINAVIEMCRVTEMGLETAHEAEMHAQGEGWAYSTRVATLQGTQGACHALTERVNNISNMSHPAHRRAKAVLTEEEK